jgi:plasmid stabilization system protein ParE
MSAVRFLPQAEAELDEIWLYIARESSSIDTANRVIEGISECFWLIAQHPQIGRADGIMICAPACAVSRPRSAFLCFLILKNIGPAQLTTQNRWCLADRQMAGMSSREL